MKYYLIFMWDHETYVHEFDNKKEALKEYEKFKHLEECKIILAKGFQLNKEVKNND